jgi:phosphoribosylformimino-5-aminoimidazole carboxamide ribotide isomerase
MIIFPAIDLKDGACVRLYQGDFRRLTVYSTDPVRVAREWQRQGATWLHIVDLDGAATGVPRNLEVIARIAARVDVPVQVGGGARSLATIERLFAAGAARVVLGTAAVEDRTLVARACDRWGDRIAVAIDARDGQVAVHGWQQTTPITALTLAQEMVALGVPRIVYTDIARDGTLSQPNYRAITELVAALPVPVIAAGGVSRLAHLQSLYGTGVEGAIVGRALYTGDLSLREAVAWARSLPA